MALLYSGTQGFFGCYCLESQSPVWHGSSYIGFTTNPRRRIRQHNGELTNGARRTKGRRPWKMVCFIGPFSSEVSGLKFEWSWTYPARSARLRRHGTHLTGRGGIAATLKTLDAMLHTPPWSLMPLTVSWVLPVSPVHKALVHVPETMREVEVELDKCSFDTGRCKIGHDMVLHPNNNNNSDTKERAEGNDDKNEETLCPICLQPIQTALTTTTATTDDLHFLPVRCVSCHTQFCVRCLATVGAARPHRDIRTGVADSIYFSSLIPRTVKCTICKTEQLWTDVLRARNEEASRLRSIQ